MKECTRRLLQKKEEMLGRFVQASCFLGDSAELNALDPIFPAFYSICHATRNGASSQIKPKVHPSICVHLWMVENQHTTRHLRQMLYS